MFSVNKFVAVTFAACLTTVSGAAVIFFNTQSGFTNYSTNKGQTVFTESFDGYSGGASSFTGTLGGVAWTASASLGDAYADFGVMSTSQANTSLLFTMGPGVKGVGGNFFATLDDITQTAPSSVYIELSNGSGSVMQIDGASQFSGFYTTEGTINSISIFVDEGPVGQSIYASAGSFSIATTVVPAPGVAALIGLAGLITTRRRRA